MKATLQEHEGCFAIELEAENLPEAATLTRFAMNRTDRVRHAGSTVSLQGEFSSCVTFAKSRRANNDIPKRP